LTVWLTSFIQNITTDFMFRLFPTRILLTTFLNKTDKIDILLISPDFYSDELDLEKVVAPQ